MMSIEDLRRMAASFSGVISQNKTKIETELPASVVAETARRIVECGQMRRGELTSAAFPAQPKPIVATASEILRCAALARGEIKPKPPAVTGLAAEILAAGRKRRNDDVGKQ
jgi:hypothetical protein